ncbi:MAG: DNA translocase FtsK 4TM domain-containing protein, partial [Gammaproteobacteria bacterium]
MAQQKNRASSEPLGDEWVRGMREVLLLGMTALALFFLISLATFSLDDPGWTSSGSGTPVKNAGGAIGAWISDFFLAVFGVMAAFFPIMILYRGVTAYREGAGNKNPKNALLRWTGFVMTVVSGASLAYVHFVRISFQLPGTSGGLLGEEIGQLLINGFGVTGSTLLLLSCFLAGVTLSTGFSWIAMIDGIGRYTLLVFVRSGALCTVVIQRLRSRQAKRQSVDIAAPSIPVAKTTIPAT